MGRDRLSVKLWVERIVLGLLFVTIGSSIMILFNPWGKGLMLDRIDDYLTKIGVSIFLLVVAVLARKSKAFKKY
jgi:hypothetical protein